MTETSVQLTSVHGDQDDHQLQQQEEEFNNTEQQINTNPASSSNPPPSDLINSDHQQQEEIRQPGPNLPLPDLITGPRENYFKIAVPLYEASIKCDWKAAEAIFNRYPHMQLVRYSITENCETSLHVAASAKGPKHVEKFVNNLVGKMKESDLKLQNKKHNTALHLAAAAGNITTVKVLVENNTELLNIAGNESMLPLYTAALFGNEDVVKYLYNKSQGLRHHCWEGPKRGWLLQRCVENDMFDVALQILNTHPNLSKKVVLGVLAQKREAFPDTKTNIISRTINWAKHKMLTTHDQLQVGSGNGLTESSQRCEPFPETESNIIKRIIKSGPERKNALPLLRFIWEDIAKKPKHEIDEILRGPPDLITQNNETIFSRWAIALQLKKLIYEHVDTMEVQSRKIITQDINAAWELQNLISELLVKLHAETQNIIKQDNKTVSAKGDHALKLQKLILEYIAILYDKTQNIMKNDIPNEEQASQLKSAILKYCENIKSDAKKIILDTRLEKKRYSSRVLFLAAKTGNTNFLVELIRRYPDLIWKVNDDNQSIFHIAVKHRHEGIYNLLYEIGALKDLITPIRDPKNNNMLHLVGKIAKQKQLEDVSGVALQMQRELLWFQEVKNMIPPSYREKVNEDGLTPHELFTMEHKELVTQGEKWMKGTTSQFMVVAALIATIVFAAAFTVPGGYAQTNDNQIPGQHNGIPVFHSKVLFWVFVVADAISLFLSCASILIFLSILTSRYAESDFRESLPNKLVLGLLTLFLSITTMTIAFVASFFVLYHKGLLWMPILICVFAVVPVILYICLQYGLFSDVIRSWYLSRYLFKPGKHVLYYENPKF